MKSNEIVQPFTSQWLRTVSFGDVIKLVLISVGMIAAYVTLHDKVDNLERLWGMQSEQLKEQRTEDMALIERHFSDIASRVAENRVEMVHQMDKISDRLDGRRNRKIDND